MNIYYVYAYLREDGTPYYIGKGSNNRAWSKTKGEICLPKNPKNIIIVEGNLTETGSLAIERRLIRWYGRKDLGTGVLRNKTDGGDGATNKVCSAETKAKISVANTGKKHTIKTKNKLSIIQTGRKHTEESIEKMKLKIMSAEAKAKISVANKGKIVSEETRKKLSLHNTGIKRGPYKKHQRCE